MTGAKTSAYDFSSVHGSTSNSMALKTVCSRWTSSTVTGWNDDSSGPWCSLTANTRRADDARASEMLSHVRLIFSARNYLAPRCIKIYYAPAPRVGGIKRWCACDVCLSVAYIGPQNRATVCIGDVDKWMASNRLQQNAAKTEVLWCTSNRQQHLVRPKWYIFCLWRYCQARKVRSRSGYISGQRHLSMKTHVSRTVSSCFAALRQIRSISVVPSDSQFFCPSPLSLSLSLLSSRCRCRA